MLTPAHKAELQAHIRNGQIDCVYFTIPASGGSHPNQRTIDRYYQMVYQRTDTWHEHSKETAWLKEKGDLLKQAERGVRTEATDQPPILPITIEQPLPRPDTLSSDRATASGHAMSPPHVLNRDLRRIRQRPMRETPSTLQWILICWNGTFWILATIVVTCVTGVTTFFVYTTSQARWSRT